MSNTWNIGPIRAGRDAFVGSNVPDPTSPAARAYYQIREALIRYQETASPEDLIALMDAIEQHDLTLSTHFGLEPVW